MSWKSIPVTLSFALGKTRNASNHTMPIDRLVMKHFTAHKIRPDKDRDGFSCELVNDAPAGEKGKNLKNVNAKAWPLLAFDFDDGSQSYEEAAEKLRAEGVAFIGYSSFNHMRVKDDAPPVPKFRIIVFIAEPCVLHDDDAEECSIRHETYKCAYRALVAHFGWNVDSSCANPARLFYLPMHDGSEASTENAFIDLAGYAVGTPLDFNKYFDVARAVVVAEHEAAQKKKEEREAKQTAKVERKATFETVGLDRFKQFCGAHFAADTWIGETFDGVVTASGSVEAVCVNQDNHNTSPGDNRRTMYAFGPGAPDGKGGVHEGPHVGCNHASCNLGTWGYIDALCQKLDDPIESMLAYVTSDAVIEEFRRNSDLPRGYRRRGGRIQGETLAADPVWLDLCRDFQVGPRVHDENSAGWGTEIVFKNDLGADVSVVVLKRDLQKDTGEICASIADLGLGVTTQPVAKQLFIGLLNNLQPTTTRVNYGRPGWHGETFVTAMGDVIGGDEAGRLDARRVAPVHAPGGSRDAYNKDVLGKLKDPRLIHLQLGVLAGCAGPLMKLLGLESRLLYWGGHSKRGKSTSQALQVSVWATPRPGDGLLFPCRATANGLEALLARGRDQTTALDELRQMQERELHSLVFNLAAGQSKTRMRRDLEMQRSWSWDSQVITLSGEQSVSQLLGDKGRVAGEVVRMPNVDVGTLAAHDNPRFVKAISTAAKENFGWLGPDVVRFVLKTGWQDDASALRDIYDDKLRLLVRSNAATEHEAASLFALLWTVGYVLVKGGLLPEDWDIETAVRWAFDVFASSSDAGRMDANQTAYDALMTYLIANPMKFPLGDMPSAVGYQGADGWRLTGKWGCNFDGKCDVWCIRVDVFERIAGEHTNVASFKTWLKERDVLVPESDKNLIHKWVPGVGEVKHYRVRMAAAPSGDGATAVETAAAQGLSGLTKH